MGSSTLVSAVVSCNVWLRLAANMLSDFTRALATFYPVRVLPIWSLLWACLYFNIKTIFHKVIPLDRDAARDCMDWKRVIFHCHWSVYSVFEEAATVVEAVYNVSPTTALSITTTLCMPSPPPPTSKAGHGLGSSQGEQGQSLFLRDPHVAMFGPDDVLCPIILQSLSRSETLLN
jgi:hypothetical protein